jgi:hypothetical protein
MIDAAANVSDKQSTGSAEVQPAEQSRLKANGDMPEAHETTSPECLAASGLFLSECEYCGICPPDVVFYGVRSQTEKFLCTECWVAHSAELLAHEKGNVQ